MNIGQGCKVKESCCTSCGKKLDMATSVEGYAVPLPGDISICIKCGHIMAFGDDLMLRDLNDREAYDVAGDRRILAVQEARRKSQRI